MIEPPTRCPRCGHLIGGHDPKGVCRWKGRNSHPRCYEGRDGARELRAVCGRLARSAVTADEWVERFRRKSESSRDVRMAYRRARRILDMHPGIGSENYWTWRDREWTHVMGSLLLDMASSYEPPLVQEWEPRSQIDYYWFFRRTICPAVLIEHENDASIEGWARREFARLAAEVARWNGVPLSILITYAWEPRDHTTISTLPLIRRAVERELNGAGKKTQGLLANRFVLIVGREDNWRHPPDWVARKWTGTILAPM